MNSNDHSPIALSPKINSFLHQNQHNNKLNQEITEFQQKMVSQQQQLHPIVNGNTLSEYSMTANLGKELVNNQISKISVLLSVKNDSANANSIANAPTPQMASKIDTSKTDLNLAPLMTNFMNLMNVNSANLKKMETNYLLISSEINKNLSNISPNVIYYPPSPVPIQNTILNFFHSPTIAPHPAKNQSNQIGTGLNINWDR